MSLHGCIESLDWNRLHFQKTHLGTQLPTDILIAPSRNLLSPEAFSKRHDVPVLDEKIKQTIQDHQLVVPSKSPHALQLSSHCLAASMHFLQRYRKEHRIQPVADSMKNGVDVESAQTTGLYNQLMRVNPRVFSDETAEKVGSYRIQKVLAKNIGLSLNSEMVLNYPIQEIVPYVKAKLPPGEYLIQFPKHVMALVKDDQGNVFVFDPNQGTVDITGKAGEQWFVQLLKSYRVHVDEVLSLNKLEGADNGKDKVFESTVINYEEAPPELKYVPGKGRWGVAQFTWRGKTLQLPWDSKTGYIYNNNSMKLLRAKFFMLTPRMWIDTSLRVIYHTALAVLKTLVMPIAIAKRRGQSHLKSIAASVGEIFRAIIFGVVGCAVSFYGFFKPLDGRRIYGHLERTLNRQNHQVDIRVKYYIAPCFKPVNFGLNKESEADKHAGNIKVLKGFFLRSENFKGSSVAEIFLGWRKALPCCR